MHLVRSQPEWDITTYYCWMLCPSDVGEASSGGMSSKVGRVAEWRSPGADMPKAHWRWRPAREARLQVLGRESVW